MSYWCCFYVVYLDCRSLVWHRCQVLEVFPLIVAKDVRFRRSYDIVFMLVVLTSGFVVVLAVFGWVFRRQAFDVVGWMKQRRDLKKILCKKDVMWPLGYYFLNIIENPKSIFCKLMSKFSKEKVIFLIYLLALYHLIKFLINCII